MLDPNTARTAWWGGLLSKASRLIKKLVNSAPKQKSPPEPTFAHFPAFPVYYGDGQEPNCWKGRKGIVPKIVILHVTYGGFNSVVSTFRNENKSAHIILDKDGTLYRMVDDIDTARTVGRSAVISLNVEMIYTGDHDAITHAQYVSLKALVEWWCWKWNIPLSYPETGGAKLLTECQYQAFIAHGGICGHSALSVNKAGDPPNDFDWEFMG
jgi:N-acetyl-anhydromuramyl-L-alanine amidase AmpD